MKELYVVLYDGSCGFCNFWVKWILKRDRHEQFYFASLQSEYGQAFLNQHNLPLTDFDTLYLVSKANTHIFYKKSAAVITIAQHLGGIYSLFVVFKLVPKFIRDWVYDIIAHNRKKVMNNSCYLPNAKERGRFL